MPLVGRGVLADQNGSEDAIQGFAAGIQGFAAGAAAQEQRRQFDENLRQNNQQFNGDLSFRIEQLKVMQREGKLNRDQQERLSRLLENEQTHRLERGFQQQTSERLGTQDFQNANREDMQDFSNLEREDTQVHEKKLQDDRLRVQVYGINTDATTTRRGQTLDFKIGQRAADNADRRVTESNALAAERRVLDSQLPNGWNGVGVSQDQRDLASLTLAKQETGEERWSQLTPEQQALIIRDAGSRLQTHAKRWEALQKETVAVQQAAASAQRTGELDAASQYNIGSNGQVTPRTVGAAAASGIPLTAPRGTLGKMLRPDLEGSPLQIFGLPDWDYAYISGDTKHGGMGLPTLANDIRLNLEPIVLDALEQGEIMERAGLDYAERGRNIQEMLSDMNDVVDRELFFYDPSIRDWVKDTMELRITRAGYYSVEAPDGSYLPLNVLPPGTTREQLLNGQLPPQTETPETVDNGR